MLLVIGLQKYVNVFLVPVSVTEICMSVDIIIQKCHKLYSQRCQITFTSMLPCFTFPKLSWLYTD